MGCYVNPSDMSKEEWLSRYANELQGGPPQWSKVLEGNLPVCLVYNSVFTAASVAYSEHELAQWCDPFDSRRKRWFIAPIEELLKVCPLGSYYGRS